MSEKIGLMICGHGSRDARAVAEFARLAERIRARLREDWPVAHGYLEFARPVIREGLDALRARGCSRILAVPGMLFAAGHAKNDIPSVLNTYAAEHGLRIDYARELGLDPNMLKAAADRVEEALARAGDGVHRHDTLLLVVGRGSSDPDANANVAKLTRMLLEGFGFGWAETAYSGVTFPLVGAALEHVVRLGFRRIVVFPYFLFTGILVERIYAAADAAARAHPEVEIVKAPYLNDHPLVVDTFIERARGILAGDTAMNCGLCKYRVRVLGFEHQVGEPQMSHHHHVEGIGTGHDHPHHHHHDHDHDPARHPHHHVHDHEPHPAAPGDGARSCKDNESVSNNESYPHRESHHENHLSPPDPGHGSVDAALSDNGQAHVKGDTLQPDAGEKGGDARPVENRRETGEEAGRKGAGAHRHHGRPHDHRDHGHDHAHAPYPHADHPLGPRSLKENGG